jgi:hypothetical protein
VPDPNPARGERRILHEEPGAPQPCVGLPAMLERIAQVHGRTRVLSLSRSFGRRLD